MVRRPLWIIEVRIRKKKGQIFDTQPLWEYGRIRQKLIELNWVTFPKSHWSQIFLLNKVRVKVFDQTWNRKAQTWRNWWAQASSKVIETGHKWVNNWERTNERGEKKRTERDSWKKSRGII